MQKNLQRIDSLLDSKPASLRLQNEIACEERGINKLPTLLNRAKRVAKEEGLPALANKIFVRLTSRIFRYATLYCFEHTLRERNEADFLPKIHDFTLKIIPSADEVEKLSCDGFDFGRYGKSARYQPGKGATLFCIFAGRELAHMGYVVTNEKTHLALEPPFPVNYANREASTGGTGTVPKYRGKGLMAYGYFKRFQFLMENGITTSRNAVVTDNIISQKVMIKFEPRVYAKLYFLRILRWKFWREKPIDPPQQFRLQKRA